MSVRSSYESLIIPQALATGGALVRFVHRGFQGHEEESVDRYFGHYGIELPSFPILDPEFSNPLFLRVLCESVQSRGLRRIPAGLRGFTAVFRFFLDSVNEKLARPSYLDYDAQRDVVMQAITGLVEDMVASETDYLPREVAAGILEGVLPRAGFDKSLLRRLLDEGILTEELIWMRQKPAPGSSPAAPISLPVVRFQYQRFADYLIVQHLLTPHLNRNRPEDAFAPGERLGRILGDPQLCRRYQGMIEALAVLIPESIGRELSALVPACGSFESVKHAVSRSLVWRRTTSISPATWSYIEQTLLPDNIARNSLLHTLVLVAPDPAHPYNARFLHDWLFPMRIVERDAWWSTFLGYEYAQGGVVGRVLRWAESIADTRDPNNDARGLATVLLTWFLTSSSRVLRDRATKALVGLLTGTLLQAAKLFDAFSAVNDDYVLERLAAAVYGAVMRCQDADAVGRVAGACYQHFFERRRPPTNALTRDYLRGIVEMGIQLKTLTATDSTRLRPPYGAALPSWFDSSKGPLELDWHRMESMPVGLRSVYSSVTNHDFSWYVLRELCGNFLSAKLGDPAAPTRREIYEMFRRGLTGAQLRAWEEYRGSELTLSESRLRLQELPRRPEEASVEQPSDKARAREEFEATLSDQQKDVFRREVRLYVEKGIPGSTRSHIALGAVQDFVLAYVRSIGWRQELDDFDRSSVLSSGDMENRVERIGKKYQWIAFYNLIGVLADNFQCAGDSYDSASTYEGPWQIAYARNIDPSLRIRSKPADFFGGECWWAPKAYHEWAEELDELEWLKRESDLPAVDKDFLIVSDATQDEWFVLEGHYEWTQPASAGREHYELPQRQLRYTITTCLVRTKHASSVLKSMLNLHLPRPHFLEPRHVSDPFLGEMHWAPVYMSQLRPYYGYDGWSRDSLPHCVLVATEQYYAEPGSYDGSMDESVTLVCPSHWIVEKLGLKWNGVEGEWCGGTPRRTIFRDPSAHTPGPTALLASRKDMERFLVEEDCTIVWFISETKWVIGGGLLHGKPTGRRLISGAMRLRRGSLVGDVRSWLETPAQ